MKALLSLLFGLSFSVSVYADCSTSGLWVFPTGKTVKQNSIFVISGYAQSQHIISGLNKKYNLYLKSGQKRIKLIVSEICIGQFYLTQAILKPESELEAGLDYTMYIDSLPWNERLARFNQSTQQFEAITFKVIPEKDIEPPQLFSSPKEIKKIFVEYGCGPSEYVVFSNPAKDKSDVIIRTVLKSLDSGKETIFYIEAVNGEIRVGHDMCSGAFTFDDSQQYEVEFSFLDTSGNITVNSGERIKFSRPTKANSINDE